MIRVQFDEAKNYALSKEFERASRWLSAGPFFQARLPKIAWREFTASGEPRYFFITSERGPVGDRKYSVRTISESGLISTLGEFGKFTSRKEAMRWLGVK